MSRRLRSCPLGLSLLATATSLLGQQPATADSVRCAPLPAAWSERATGGADWQRLLEITGHLPPRLRGSARPSDLLTSRASRRRCGNFDAVPWTAAAPGDALIGPAGIRLELLPARLDFEVSSAYPDDRNNGVLWAGRGMSGAVTAGAVARWGPITAGLSPVLAAQENASVLIQPVVPPGYSRFAYPWHAGRIDWPTRFGDAAFAVADPGDSFVRLDSHGFVIGLSNENLWWGPGRINGMLMSNTGPGFPHVFLGTSDALDVGIGRLQGRALWGHLAESDYFDSDPSNDSRLFAGLVLAFSPAPVPELSVGFSRAYLETLRPGERSLWQQITDPYRAPRSNPLGGTGNNQLFSLFLRFALPESGFEAYGEWAREDNWEDATDLLMEIDHSQAYTVGFQDVVELRSRWLRLWGELTHLGASTTFLSGRPAVTFYTHSQVRQGYTQRGQLLGAWIGPGSDSQSLGADLFGGWGSSGIYVQRVRYDNDAYYAVWAPFWSDHGHDVGLGGGLRHQQQFGWLAAAADLSLTHRWNRQFIGIGVGPQGRPKYSENNFHLRLTVSWTPHVGVHSNR